MSQKGGPRGASSPSPPWRRPRPWLRRAGWRWMGTGCRPRYQVASRPSPPLCRVPRIFWGFYSSDLFHFNSVTSGNKMHTHFFAREKFSVWKHAGGSFKSPFSGSCYLLRARSLTPDCLSPDYPSPGNFPRKEAWRPEHVHHTKGLFEPIP